MSNHLDTIAAYLLCQFLVQNPYVRCSDSVAYKKKIFGIVLVIAIFVAICLCSFYPFSQMTDSWALKVILFLTLLIGNVIGVLIILIGIVILICSKFFLWSTIVLFRMKYIQNLFVESSLKFIEQPSKSLQYLRQNHNNNRTKKGLQIYWKFFISDLVADFFFDWWLGIFAFYILAYNWLLNGLWVLLPAHCSRSRSSTAWAKFCPIFNFVPRMTKRSR